MEKTCTFCSKALGNSSCFLLKALMDILKKLLIVVNVESTKPVVCNECVGKVKSSSEFKARCINTESCLSSHRKCETDEKIDINLVYALIKNPDDNIKLEEDAKVCRLCMEICSTGTLLEETHFTELFEKHFPELALNITSNPIICELCLISVQNFFDFAFMMSCTNIKNQQNIIDCVPDVKKELQEAESNDANSVEKNVGIEGDCEGNITEKVKEEVKDDVPMPESKVDDSVKKFIANEIEKQQLIIDQIKKENADAGLDETMQFNFQIPNFSVKTEDPANDSAHMQGEHPTKKKAEPNRKKKRRNTKLGPTFKCALCSYETQHKCNLRTHVLIHREPGDIDMFKCHECSYETRNKSNLKLHVVLHKNFAALKLYNCEECEYVSKRKRDIQIHMLTHKDPSELKMFRCDMCEYQAKRKVTLKQHQLVHISPLVLHICEICGYKTKHKHNLKTHMLNHQNPEDITMYKCEFCSYQTNRSGNLKSHVLTHIDLPEIKLFKCDVCEYATKRKNDLRLHKLVHKDPSEVTMYQCTICSYETKRKDSLKPHMLTHTYHD